MHTCLLARSLSSFLRPSDRRSFLSRVRRPHFLPQRRFALRSAAGKFRSTRKKSVSSSVRPSVRPTRRSLRDGGGRKEGSRRTATTGKKRNLCVSPQFSSLSESVPHPRERRETLPIRNCLLVIWIQAQGCSRLRMVPDQALPKDWRFALFI